MADGRWYPNLTTLGDGSVMAFSGMNEAGGTNTSVEFYTIGLGWSQQYLAGWTPPLYPRMHLLPNGNVFYSGPGTSSALFDPATTTWTLDVANTNYPDTRKYGTSVLLPLTPANNYDPMITIMGGNNPATNSTEIIDMGAATPKWVNGLTMSEPRIEMNAVILPNGEILAVGGSVNDEDTGSLSLSADLFNLNSVNLNTTPPNLGTVSSAGANATERLYHSVALLLPNATVWLAGGNPDYGTYNNTMEIYQPPYLFTSTGALATQPTITSAPSSITYGKTFTVQTPNAATISSVVLVRNGAVTHAFGMDQRLVGMNFSVGSGSLTVTAPPNGNIAPPGYYMLFILNSSGVPSVAQMVQLLPMVSSVLPNNGPTTGGTAVTITGTNFAAGATVTFGAAAATNVVVVNSTTITATTPAGIAGAVTVTVTVNGESGSLVNGFTYTAAGTISFIQVASATPSSTATVSVTYPAAQTSGDLNIVVVGWNDTTSTVQSVKDSGGNTYSLAIGPTKGTGLQESIYYAANIVGGANTVTVTFNQSAADPDMRILEYRGVATLDAKAGASGSSTAANSGLGPQLCGVSIFAWLDDSSSVSVQTCNLRQRDSTSPTGRTIPRPTMLSVRRSRRHSMCTGRQLFRRASRWATPRLCQRGKFNWVSESISELLRERTQLRNPSRRSMSGKRGSVRKWSNCGHTLMPMIKVSRSRNDCSSAWMPRSVSLNPS
jgi:Domain of unknown function (DUF1929)/IPT/TIG domain